MTRILAAAAIAATVLTLSACSGTSAGPSTAASGGEGSDVALQVFAAASLADAFAEIEPAFEAANPGVDVRLTLAGSADLAAQITEGAPADVFASANQQQMDAVGGAVADPELFASNTLTIVVPADNPSGVTGLRDLARSDVKLVLCAPQVPCGAATQAIAEARGVTLSPVSEESNVTDVLGKVASGEADAGIVYVTDLVGADGVKGVELDGAHDAVNHYVIGTIASSPNAAAAHAFVGWVLSNEGQRVLAAHGFGAP